MDAIAKKLGITVKQSATSDMELEEEYMTHHVLGKQTKKRVILQCMNLIQLTPRTKGAVKDPHRGVIS